MSDYRGCEFCQGTGWDEDIDPDGVVDGFTEACWYCQGRGEVEDTCHCAAYCVCECACGYEWEGCCSCWD